ncbi:hypothetical protein Lser_V15G20584 [Lactuca serriola]
MTTKRRSHHSCAACRFSRRCCPVHCPFAPYFPADQPEIFRYVHRLYGTGKILRILNLLNDNVQKQEAMTSIKYESYIRHINPVNGCYGVTVYLQQKLVNMMRQLQYVRLLLDFHRRNNHDQIQDPPVKNEIISDQSVGGSSNTTTDQTIYENDQGFYFVGSSDRNANEVVSSRMESPSKNLDDQEITNDDLMRILSDFD